MFRFEKLEVWTESINYSKKIYKLSEKFPEEERFGLTSQIRRASLSISSNIAEGSGSSSVKDFCNFLDMAIKSTIETVSQILFAKELGYIRHQEVEKLHFEAELLVKRIQGLKSYLKKPRKEKIL